MEWLLAPFADQNGSVWFYDVRRHPASAALHVRHRICADQFAHVLTWVFALFACIWAIVYIVMINVGNDYFIAIASLSFVDWFLLCILGEWAMRNGKGGIAYTYVALLFGIWASLLWLAAVAVIQIRPTQVRGCTLWHGWVVARQTLRWYMRAPVVPS